MLRNLIEKYSGKMLVLMITGIAILGTQIIVLIYYKITETNMRQSEYIAGVIAPLIIASVMVSYLVALLKKLNEMEKEMRRIANVDPATKLKSRRALLEAAEELFWITKRYNKNLGVLMLDIDYFKKINDMYGHLRGDEALIALGGIINNLKRESDLAGRYGGDEILILLPETDINGCRSFGAKLLVETHAVRLKYSEKYFGFTISIGITALEGSMNCRCIDELIDRADKALYKAKSLGRDRQYIL